MNELERLDSIAQLTTSWGPTGFEDPAAQVAAEQLRPWVDEVEIDRFSNVIGVKRCGRPNPPRILLDAHLDEVGMVVSGYEKGFLRFFQLGGIDPRVLPGSLVRVLTQPPILGLVTAATGEEPDQAVPMEHLYLDVGLSQEESKRQIPLGTPVSYGEGCYRLGANRIAGKSLDDRSCFVLLVETMKRLAQTVLDVDVYVLGSVREETDSAGAIIAADRIRPTWAVAVDVTFGNTPEDSDSGFDLGGGPVIGCGPNIANWMFERMKEKAAALHLPYRVEVMAGSTGTNGWDLQISREGIATAVLSIPLNYMHTPLEVICEKDVDQTAELLAAFVRNLGEEAPRC